MQEQGRKSSTGCGKPIGSSGRAFALTEITVFLKVSGGLARCPGGRGFIPRNFFHSCHTLGHVAGANGPVSLSGPRDVSVSSSNGRRSAVARFLDDYRERHRHAANAALHVVGIPMTLSAVYLAWRGSWLIALGAFLGGYALQFLGHRLQGSEAGELALWRKLSRARRSPRLP